MAEANEFEVWQSETGYVAVTSDVRRKILAALAKKERELGDLVRITGKAKPTLSNLHVRELLAQKLVEEIPHPTDARKKIYRLKGQRIGSSNVPVEQLRGAVKRYVASSPLAHAIPLQRMVDVLLAAGPDAAPTVARQAATLGALSAHLFPEADLRETLPRIAAWLEREGITRTAVIDLEGQALELHVDPRHGDGKAARKLLAALLAGLVEGILRATRPDAKVEGEAIPDGKVRIRVG